MKTGRPFKPGNKFGRGRPRGSRNKRGQSARQLLDSQGDALLRKALKLGLQGDVPILRVLLGYILPQATEPPLRTGPLPAGTADEISESTEKVLRKVAAGRIPPGEALQITALLEARGRTIAAREYEARLSALEQRVQGPPGDETLPLRPANAPSQKKNIK
jgi:hypothetical protein